MNAKSIVVLGGTGKTGRHVTAVLEAQGFPVRSVSRSSTPRFDWGDRSTWEPVLSGASAVYLMTAESEDAVERTADLTGWASSLGVERVVLLSLRATDAAGGLFAAHEQAVTDSRLAWTILRPSWFYQNFTEGIFRDPIVNGELRLPTGAGREPFVDTRDVADAAAAALTAAGHDEQVYEMSGPRSLSLDDVVGEIAKATGREIRYTPVEAEQYIDEMTQAGIPPEIAGFLVDLLHAIRDGRSAHLCDGIQRVLGREPRDFADFVKEATASGVWNP